VHDIQAYFSTLFNFINSKRGKKIRLELKWYEARLIQTLLVYIKIFNLSIFDKNFKNEIVNVVALPLLQKMGML
jgi:hypothetical protein